MKLVQVWLLSGLMVTSCFGELFADKQEELNGSQLSIHTIHEALGQVSDQVIIDLDRDDRILAAQGRKTGREVLAMIRHAQSDSYTGNQREAVELFEKLESQSLAKGLKSISRLYDDGTCVMDVIESGKGRWSWTSNYVKNECSSAQFYPEVRSTKEKNWYWQVAKALGWF